MIKDLLKKPLIAIIGGGRCHCWDKLILTAGYRNVDNPEECLEICCNGHNLYYGVGEGYDDANQNRLRCPTRSVLYTDKWSQDLLITMAGGS